MNQLTNNPSIQLPKYRSHKEVWALKISAMDFTQDGKARIAFEDTAYAPIEVPNYREKFNGDYDDPGYYVVYKDGYVSWSPTKAFEEGYTKIES